MASISSVKRQVLRTLLSAAFDFDFDFYFDFAACRSALKGRGFSCAVQRRFSTVEQAFKPAFKAIV
jgi:hypothetical protein